MGVLLKKMTKNQWDCLLQNLGEWHGSFTRLSAHGETIEDTPTIVTLEGLDHHKTVRQTIHRSPHPDSNPVSKSSSKSPDIIPDTIPDTVLEYSTLGRGVLFFETGAFSQGSTQFNPYSEFGAEFGFIASRGDAPGDRRLRLVQLFSPGDSHLKEMTLIREHRAGTEAISHPPLQLADLVGIWQGDAITLYPDWRNPTTYSTLLTIECTGDRLTQELSLGTPLNQTVTSQAQIEGDRLLFTAGAHPVQVLLLPDGASATCPIQIQNRQPFFLEAGWLMQPNLRQRLIRTYSDRGEWISLTFVIEQRR
jgi:Domain of unknown function (DUF3598)